MKKAVIVKSIASVGLVVACASALAACGGSASSGGSNGIAATVNGVEIQEETVTEQIEDIRTQVVASAQATDETKTEDDAWGEYLVSVGQTPESLREQQIDSLVQRELIKSAAADKGVTVEESEIDSHVESMRANYDSDEAWEEALEGAGYTDETYRETIQVSLLDQGLQQTFTDSAEVSDDDILTTAQTYAQYYDGAKRSSHILFKVEDTSDEAAMAEARANAEELLARINNGEISFEDAAKENSDDSSAENGGDVGWDALNSFVTEYTDALNNLDVGQVSDPVESEFGIHIIKCTEVFKAPEEIKSIEDLPEAFRENIESMASSSAASTAYQEWLDDLKEKAEIVINPMPEDVPYNIDLTPYQEAEEETSAAVTSDDATASDAEAATADAEDAGDAAEATEAAEGEGTASAGDDAAAAEGAGEAGQGEAAEGEAAEGETTEGEAAAQ